MLINSLSFLGFFIVVFALYWSFAKRLEVQKWILVLSSCVYYAWFDYRFLSLILISSVAVYYLGNKIREEQTETIQKRYMTLGVVFCVGILAYFKYTNFFIESIVGALSAIGFKAHIHTLSIIAPVGLSYYTFKLVSYLVDIYWGKYKIKESFLDFFNFISFFPTITSGPIDRPKAFIKQLQQPKSFDYDMAVDGCRMILWGLFKKLVVADNCAITVNRGFSEYTDYAGSSLFILAVLFTIQLYADFSGYSDMAIGVGRLLGFKVAINFKTPFFALNVADYWRRWHISLTKWVTDYVYSPLVLNWRDKGKIGLIAAIMINLIVVGVWHGAEVKWLVFGIYHGLLFIPLILIGGNALKNREIRVNKLGLPVFGDFMRILFTFLLVVIGGTIIRCDNFEQFFGVWSEILSKSIMSYPSMDFVEYKCVFFAAIILFADWVQRDKQHALQLPDKYIFKYNAVRLLFYAALLLFILLFQGVQSDFIYFQF